MNQLKIRLIFKLLLLANVVFCSQIISTTEYADLLFAEEKFDEAAKLYEEETSLSTQTLYNLGYCYYRLEKEGRALLYWMRAAEKCSFDDYEKVCNAINLIKRDNENDDQSITSKLNLVIKKRPLLLFQVLFLIFWVLFLFCLSKLSKNYKKLLVLPVFLILVISSMILLYKYVNLQRNIAIIVVDKAALMSGPGKDFHNMHYIPEASSILILDQKNAYFKVKHANKIGWVAKSEAEIV